ncbi:MAG TPA: hypothetical protein VKP30_30625 [Polyangiaceae bacterium]|nr:hypothetical protein [Polyangiaceae bacterium]
MTPAELRNKQLELSRALRAGRDAEAEQIALDIAPAIERICDELDLDLDPKAITPQWGILA